MSVRTPPYHDAKESLEIRGVHDDDDLIGCQFLLLHHDASQLPLHPLRTASVRSCDLRMGLFAMGELLPDFPGVLLSLLTELLAARFTLPNLSAVVCAVLFESGRSATRTYFSWCVWKNQSISWLGEKEKYSFQHPKS